MTLYKEIGLNYATLQDLNQQRIAGRAHSNKVWRILCNMLFPR